MKTWINNHYWTKRTLIGAGIAIPSLTIFLFILAVIPLLLVLIGVTIIALLLFTAVGDAFIAIKNG